jgi:hypothetical protein
MRVRIKHEDGKLWLQDMALIKTLAGLKEALETRHARHALKVKRLTVLAKGQEPVELKDDGDVHALKDEEVIRVEWEPSVKKEVKDEPTVIDLVEEDPREAEEPESPITERPDQPVAEQLESSIQAPAAPPIKKEPEEEWDRPTPHAAVAGAGIDKNPASVESEPFPPLPDSVQEDTYNHRAAELVAKASDLDLAVEELEGGKIQQEHFEALWSKNGLNLSKEHAYRAFSYIDSKHKGFLDKDDLKAIKDNFKTKYKVVKVTTLSDSSLVEGGADIGDMMVIGTMVEGIGVPEKQQSGAVRVYVKFRNKHGWAEHTTSAGEQHLEFVSDKTSFLKELDESLKNYEMRRMGLEDPHPSLDNVKRHFEDGGEPQAKSRRLTDASWKAADMQKLEIIQARIRKWETMVFFKAEEWADISEGQIRRFFNVIHNLDVGDVQLRWGTVLYNPWGYIKFSSPSKLVLERFSHPNGVIGIHPGVFGTWVELRGYLPKLHIKMENVVTPITEELQPRLRLHCAAFGEVDIVTIKALKNGQPNFATVSFSSLTDKEGLAEAIDRGHLQIDDTSVQITEKELR